MGDNGCQGILSSGRTMVFVLAMMLVTVAAIFVYIAYVVTSAQ